MIVPICAYCVLTIISEESTLALRRAWIINLNSLYRSIFKKALQYLYQHHLFASLEFVTLFCLTMSGLHF